MAFQAIKVNDIVSRPDWAVNRWKAVKDVTERFGQHVCVKAGQRAFVCESLNHEGPTPMKRVVWTGDPNWIRQE